MRTSGPRFGASWFAVFVISLIFHIDPAFAQTQLIKHGSEEEAVAYYERIGADLNFEIGESSLGDLIAYLGYEGLSAGDLEFIEPARLAAATAEEFEELALAVEDADAFAAGFTLDDFADRPILATRYLAPRIVDISGAPPYPAGWRKLVRLNSRPGSRAEAAGLAVAWLQFDYLRPQDDPEPFPGPESADDRAAAIVQVLVVPRVGHETLTDGVYFMLFEGKSAGYAATRFVPANFDLPPDAKSPDAGFYVPTACGRCHGDVGRPSGASLVFEAGKLNFLNTDYWHDRIEPGDFFTETGSLHGVLFDGGSDPATGPYAAAFEVIRTLNGEIAAQNESVPVAATDANYQLLGVRKWQEIHGESVDHAAPMERSLGDEDERWSSEYPEDGPLLTLLSRHCYRCHNTIDFNVFLKPRFKGVAKSGISAVMFGLMPAGHALNSHNAAEAEALIEGLKQLLAQR